MTGSHPAPARDARPERTRRERLSAAYVRAQWPLGIPLAAVLVSLGFVLADRWRKGAFTFGVAALLAAVLRAVLPDSVAGLMVVRSRAFDVAVLAVAGVVTVVLALSIDSLGTGPG